MSETVKLIIEIPKDAYRACNALTTDDDQGILTFCVVNAVANGTPLDRNSELAEMQAYFSGMDYGWEKGRESLIDDVKAEISKAWYTKPKTKYENGRKDQALADMKIIDKHIGGEDK